MKGTIRAFFHPDLGPMIEFDLHPELAFAVSLDDAIKIQESLAVAILELAAAKLNREFDSFEASIEAINKAKGTGNAN